MSTTTCKVLILIIFLFIYIPGYLLAADLNWDGEPFSVPAAELLAAAAAIPAPEKEPVKVLLLENWLTIHADRRVDSRCRWIYEILNAAGKDNWAHTSEEWAAWYQHRPDIRVRVIHPDGDSHELDPATLQELTDEDASIRKYSDVKELRAPIPGVVIGSIIEEVLEVRQHQPFFPEGVAQAFTLSRSVPLHLRRIVIDVADGIPFQYKVDPTANVSPRIEKTETGLRFIFEHRDVPADPDLEDNLPPDQVREPLLTFSTARSWADIGRAYDAMVRRQVEGAELTELLADLKAEDCMTTALNCVGWMNEHIRYVSMSVGDRSLLPATTAEIMERGYGDCKDKASLLVGMLRQAGYTADVALLRSGFGRDIDPDLPGLGRLDHAIVCIEGEVPIWLDPTAEYSRDGYLPLSDQDRWALVCNREEPRLVKTPSLPSSANHIEENREFILKSTGYADVIETNRFTGGIEPAVRIKFRNIKKEEMEQNLRRYIDGTYRFGELKEYDISSSEDLTKPFHLQMTITGAGRAITQRNEALAAILISHVFKEIPAEFKDADPDKPRKEPYYFYCPLVYECRYLIRPPRGFVALPLPEDAHRTMGTFTLDQEYVRHEDQTVEVRFRLDTGKRRLTPEEFETTRRQVTDLLKSDFIRIGFDHEGVSLMNQGKYREALDLFHRLAESEPAEVIHLLRWADALLQAGFGDQARLLAQRAVTTAPESHDAFVTLARILENDDLGRRFGPGYDRAGAMAAYRKALELDPEKELTRVELAIVCQYDEFGFNFTARADMETAVELYRQALTAVDNGNQDLKEEKLVYNLALCLAAADKFDELDELVPRIRNTRDRHVFSLIAGYGREGTGPARERAALIQPLELQRDVLRRASDILLHLRHYSAAAEFLRQAAQGAENVMELETRADLIGKVVRHEDLSFNRQDPGEFVKFVLRQQVLAGADGAALASWYAPELFASYNKPELTDHETFRSIYELTICLARQKGFPLDVFLDLLLADLEVGVAGDDETGYRVGVTFPRVTDELARSMFLVRTDEGLKIAGSSWQLAATGAFLHCMLQAEKTPLVKCWLNWLREYYAEPSADDRFSAAPFALLWPADGSDDVAVMSAAAAHLMSRADHAKKGVDLLITCLQNTEPEFRRMVLEFSLATAYFIMDDYPAMLEHTQRLREYDPQSERIRNLWWIALNQNGRFETLEKELRSLLDENPRDPEVLHALATMRMDQADVGGTIEVYLDMMSKSLGDEGVYNNLAWVHLFADEIPEKAFEYARTAVQLSGSEAGVLHTLATLYAESGRCQEARQVLDHVLKSNHTLRPQYNDWYILGRIAEHYALFETARQHYAKVLEDRSEDDDPFSVKALARRGLARLDAVAGGEQAAPAR